MSRELNISRDVEDIARNAVDALFHLHTDLGPGLLESVYATCFEEELRYRGIKFVREAAIPLHYRSRQLEVGFRADFIIRDQLLIELKAVESLLPVHLAQVITYLKLSDLELGLLVNLNVPLVKDGIRRVFNPKLS